MILVLKQKHKSNKHNREHRNKCILTWVVFLVKKKCIQLCSLGFPYNGVRTISSLNGVGKIRQSYAKE